MPPCHSCGKDATEIMLRLKFPFNYGPSLYFISIAARIAIIAYAFRCSCSCHFKRIFEDYFCSPTFTFFLFYFFFVLLHLFNLPRLRLWAGKLSYLVPCLSFTHCFFVLFFLFALFIGAWWGLIRESAYKLNYLKHTFIPCRTSKKYLRHI